eukprot:4810255-Amphidinium_carterae.1
MPDPLQLRRTARPRRTCLVESMVARCRVHLAEYVLKIQENIFFGVDGYHVDVEADEITFAKRAAAGGGVTWTQYLGLVRCGSPETLMLIKLPDRVMASGAPGPGPLLSKDWAPIAEKYCTGQNMILNTDSAAEGSPVAALDWFR